MDLFGLVLALLCQVRLIYDFIFLPERFCHFLLLRQQRIENHGLSKIKSKFYSKYIFLIWFLRIWNILLPSPIIWWWLDLQNFAHKPIQIDVFWDFLDLKKWKIEQNEIKKKNLNTLLERRSVHHQNAVHVGLIGVHAMRRRIEFDFSVSSVGSELR